jgi:p-hydroxybenzoate 3-monooxygenase
MRTQVAIIGAGPAGLLLSQLLHRAGIDSVVLEDRSRAHVEGRIRAGILEPSTVELLRAAGAEARLDREGLVHHGIEIAVEGERHRIPLSELTGGRAVTAYGQTKVVQDLIQLRLAEGGDLRFETPALGLADLESERPRVAFRQHATRQELVADFIAGCDGFHGIARDSIPASARRCYERLYPFAWLGILVEAEPVGEELVYAAHSRGFALFSLRSRQLARNYIQCAPTEDLALWPDQRIFDEMRRRLEDDAGRLVKIGRVLDKSLTPMRSFVVEPMRYGRLFLAGDAAHIVTPTGAKGLNLAAADVRLLSQALIAFYRSGATELLESYSDRALARVWKAQRFSWWMTSMLHNFPDAQSFETRLRRAELDYLLSSRAAMTALAENYVGLPFATA